MQIHYVQVIRKAGKDVKLNQARDDHNYDIDIDSGNKKGSCLYNIGYQMNIFIYK
jgi:hypothetical protein